MRRPTLLSIGALCAGLALAPSARAEDWVRDQWTTRQGLPQNSITGIAQGPDGYVWLSTYGGLVRFDGIDFVLLDTDETPGLTAERFLSVDVQPDGTLWVGSQGEGLFRIRDGVAKSFGPKSNVWRIDVDRDGVVWAVVEGGVLRVEADRVDSIALEGHARHFLRFEGSLAAVTDDGWATCIDGRCPPLPTARAPSLGQNWAIDDAGDIVAATVDGILRWTGTEWQPVSVPAEGRPLLRPPSCETWGGETWCVHGDRPFRLRDIPPELPDLGATHVNATFVDREGGLWIGLDGHGVHRLQPTDVEYLGPSNSILGVVEAPASEVWTMHQEPDAKRARNHPWPPHTLLWQEAPGVALGVTPEGTIIRRSAAGMRTEGRVVPARGPPGFALATAGPWLASRGVVYRVGTGTVTAEIEAARLGARTVRPLRGDADGVWLVLDERRLFRWPNGGPEIDLLDLAPVRDLWAQDGRVWLATYGDGLVLVENGGLVGRLSPEFGGCDTFVSHIFDLGDGRLWLNTNRGVGRLSVAEAVAAIHGDRLASCNLVGSREGNGPHGLVSTRGEILAPTIRGVARILPDRLVVSRPPQLDLRTMVYGTEDLLRGGLAEGHAQLRVSFGAPYFRDPHAVRYRYRLVGLDEDGWSTPRRVQTVHFQNLAPGDYVLEAQARGLTAWSPPVRFAFTRHPTFWERPVARYGVPGAILLLVFGLLAVNLLQTRERAAEVRREMTGRLRAQEELQIQQAENARIRQETENARRLEAIGRLAGGIAHDFNNLFMVVSAHAAMLEDHADDEVREEAAGLHDVVDRGAAVARGLLLFGRPQSAKDGALDLGQRVQELIPLLRRLIRADLTLEVDCAPGCTVHLDPGRADQVVSNLVLNARDATEGAGTIKITVTRAADRVVLHVADDGRGMTEAQRAQALEPYFTTKALGQGTGLGLSTVHGVVRDAGGEVELDSAPDEGTRVTVRLPYVAAARPEAAAAPASTPAISLHVLVVEDREEVRRGMKAILRSLEWSGDVVGSLAAADAAVARRMPDLVLCDVVMPEHSGPEVRDALQARHPGLPVLFMSGYVDPSLTGLRREDTVLRKPFTPQQLAEAVMRLRSTTTSA